ncbi:MAG TPA: hypothetical protein HPP77_05895 [Candidatus Hydrogenedentes bacterium]|nr:hypothetical protein [Candidatus Hydrogenedentota bacterium]
MNDTMALGRARELLERWQGKRVAVVGDLMLDRYVWGNASRISPEAPVPVVAASRTSAAPGGSANVVRNLASLGAAPTAFGLIGDDAAGRELRELLEALPADLTGVIAQPARRTVEKTRIIAGNQQVVRVDVEDPTPADAKAKAELLERIQGQAEHGRLDAVIVEDYAKGTLDAQVLAEICGLGKANGFPVALDPHPANPFNVKGLAALTPNRKEAFILSGTYCTEPAGPVEEDAPLLAAARKLHELWAPDHLLVTLGPGGMALFDQGRPALHIRTQAREVFDVAGAGDTVIASFTLALIAGASAQEAAVVSNHAAGVVVGKVGAAPVARKELLRSLEPDE